MTAASAMAAAQPACTLPPTIERPEVRAFTQWLIEQFQVDA